MFPLLREEREGAPFHLDAAAYLISLSHPSHSSQLLTLLSVSPASMAASVLMGLQFLCKVEVFCLWRQKLDEWLNLLVLTVAGAIAVPALRAGCTGLWLPNFYPEPRFKRAEERPLTIP